MSEIEEDSEFYGRQLSELGSRLAAQEAENIQLWALSNDVRSHVEGLAEAWTSRPLTEKSTEAHRERYRNGETLKAALASIDSLASERKILFSSPSPAAQERPRESGQLAWGDVAHFLREKLRNAVRSALAAARK